MAMRGHESHRQVDLRIVDSSMLRVEIGNANVERLSFGSVPIRR